MDKVKNVPEIRFKGFDDEWKDCFIEEFGKVKSCKRIYRDETSDYGDVPFYKIGTFGSKADAFIDYQTYEYYKKNFAYPRSGDILISASGSLGKVVEYMGEVAYFQDSNIVWLDIENNFLQNKFLKHLYSYVSWDTVEGSTIKRLYNKDILSKEIIIPSKDEQLKIANIFELLHEKLELEKEKHEKLINYKKAMLEDMFPKEGKNVPKVRFDGFNDEWDKINLERHAIFLKGKGYKRDDLISFGQEIILYGKMYTNYKTAYTESDSFASLQYGSVLSQAGDVIVPASGETAEDISIASAVLKNNIILGGDLNIIRPNDYLDSIFLALSLSTGSVKNELTKMAEGATIAHLRNNNLKSVTMLAPSPEEQSLIGNFFKNLDEKIELLEKKITKIENFKKAMLEKMFV